MQINWVKIVSFGLEPDEITAGKGKNANEPFSKM